MPDLRRLYGSGFSRMDTYEEMTRFSRRETNNRTSSMTIHHIMPGVDFYYNRFYSHDCVEAEYTPESLNIIEINHCRSGRFGCRIGEKGYIYIGEGEIEANILGINRLSCEFPVGFYEGIGIFIGTDRAADYIFGMFPDIAQQIRLLKEHIEQDGGVMLVRSVPELNHIFDELYSVDPRTERSYISLKVLEIILTMQTVPYGREQQTTKYFRRSDVEKIRAMHREAVSRLAEKIPMSDMALRYGMPLTAAKSCFREIYGSPYYTYMKRYRIHKAVHMLENKDMSVADIALTLGYGNPSKFSAAFRSVMGCTPREYRNNADHMEHLKLLGVEIE